MNNILLKALSKKNKWIENKEKNKDFDDESDGDITSEDELEISKSYVPSIFNDQYVCLKYLGVELFVSMACIRFS